MPILIDGYNLYHYVRAVYAEDGIDLRVSTFCKLVAEWAKFSKHKVTIVFDGNPPPDLARGQKRVGPTLLVFTGSGASADEYIRQRVCESSAPKLLVVVSNDREIKKYAKRRKCKLISSEDFWWMIAKSLTKNRKPAEPKQKRTGISSEDLGYWLDYFGIED